MVVLGWLFGIAVAAAVIAVAVVFLNRFYRKSTRDIALVRTGFGGQRILISGGCLALPFLHRIEEINMRTFRIEVRRTGGEIADHRRPHAGRRRARILRARDAHARRHRDRRAGDRREVLHARRHAQSAGRPLHRRDPSGRGRPHDGFTARAARRIRAQHRRPAARESEPERHPARLGLAHPARPGAVLGAWTRTTPSTPSGCASSPRSSRSTRRSAPRSRPTPRSRCGRPSSRRPSAACS